MSEYTMTRSDAEPEKRTWQGGHFCVKKDGNTIGLFVFDYPECECRFNVYEAEALAAAKSFMAIDDLVAALLAAQSTLPIGGELGLVDAALKKAGEL